MVNLYGYKRDGYWEFQKDTYHDEGWVIRVVGNRFECLEGELEHLEGTFDTLDEAYDFCMNKLI